MDCRYQVIVTTNTGKDNFKKEFENYDKLIYEMGDTLENVYDEFERKHPKGKVGWINRFWGDTLMKQPAVMTIIYVDGDVNPKEDFLYAVFVKAITE